MRPVHLLSIAVLIVVALSAMCAKDEDDMKADNSLYNFGQKIGTITDSRLYEISGLAASIRYPDCFWVNNDSGDSGNIYLINLSGELIATLSLHISNRDWEGIAIADGYIYIGEVGDNAAIYTDKRIYRVAEPTTIETSKLDQQLTSSEIETMRFNFADGKRDCETLMFDPISSSLVMVSKREEQVRVYTSPFIVTSASETLLLESCATLDFTLATSGDISLCGKKILVKSCDDIYLWEREGEESIGQLLSREPQQLAYAPEPQGEAIAWSTHQDLFYTISEKRWNEDQAIYIYTRVEL